MPSWLVKDPEIACPPTGRTRKVEVSIDVMSIMSDVVIPTRDEIDWSVAPSSGTTIVTAGGVVWQLWHLIFNNRMSGYYAASMLLRVCMLYLNAQQQSVLSTFSQRLGPFAGVQLISPSEIASALPG